MTHLKEQNFKIKIKYNYFEFSLKVSKYQNVKHLNTK